MMHTMSIMTKTNQIKVYKTPLRKCVATGEQLLKNDLIRVVRSKDGEVVVDPTGKKNGRGAYLKKSIDAVELAKKRKILNRAFGQVVDDEIYTQLVEYIQGE